MKSSVKCVVISFPSSASWKHRYFPASLRGRERERGKTKASRAWRKTGKKRAKKEEDEEGVGRSGSMILEKEVRKLKLFFVARNKTIKLKKGEEDETRFHRQWRCLYDTTTPIKGGRPKGNE